MLECGLLFLLMITMMYSEAYKGEEVSINSDGQIYFHPNDDEFESSVIR